MFSDLGYKAYADQLLGHATKSVTDIYTRTSVKPLLAMVEEAGKHIMTHLGFTDPPTSQVALHPQVCCPRNSQLPTFI